jgi:hypothetical protein
VLGHRVHRLTLRLAITGNAFAGATDAALQGYAIGRGTDGAPALATRLPRWREALTCLASGVTLLLGLLKPRGSLLGAARGRLVPGGRCPSGWA